MAMKTGVRLDYKQEAPDSIMNRAKAESRFSERLYEILFEYQERLHDKKYQPASESERIDNLCPALSRLYNQIWAEVMSFSYKGKSKKKKMEVIA